MFQLGRPVEEQKLQAFDGLCTFLDNEGEHQLFTLTDLHNIMQKISKPEGCQVYGQAYLKIKLIKRYEDRIYFTSEGRRQDILCFKETTNEILRKFQKLQSSDDDDSAKKRKLLDVAVSLIIDDIRTQNIDDRVYPHPKDLTKPSTSVPDSLLYFLRRFTKSDKKAQIWGQNFVRAVRPRSGIMPYSLGCEVADRTAPQSWLL